MNQTEPFANQAAEEAEAPQQRSAVTEAFHQLNQVSSLLDEQSETESPQVTQPMQESGGTEEDEVSIEEYMAQLLARNGFSPTDDPAPVPAQRQVPQATPQPPVANDVANTEEATNYVQKAAPECRDDLSNMRELANMNARTAIGSYSERRMVVRMRMKLVMSAGMMLLSLALTSLTTSVQSLTFVAAALATITAVTWTMQYCRLSRQMLQQAEQLSIMGHPMDEDELEIEESPTDPSSDAAELTTA